MIVAMPTLSFLLDQDTKACSLVSHANTLVTIDVVGAVVYGRIKSANRL